MISGYCAPRYPVEVRYPVLWRHPIVVDLSLKKPCVRADCASLPRPCPFISCKYNLFVEIGPKGSLDFTWPRTQPHQMPQSCALDLADEGGLTVQELADEMRLGLDVVKKSVDAALRSVRYKVARMRLSQELKD